MMPLLLMKWKYLKNNLIGVAYAYQKQRLRKQCNISLGTVIRTSQWKILL